MDVDPWAVVIRHGRWYLLGWSHTADARRVLRVDRVVSIEALADTFAPPDDLNPVADVEAQLGSGWRYSTEVIIDAPLEALRATMPGVLGRCEAIDASTTRVVGSTNNLVWYLEELAMLDVSYRIVGPDEFRRAARNVAAKMLAAAGTGTDT